MCLRVDRSSSIVITPHIRWVFHTLITSCK